MKYFGEIGYAITEETVPGVWEPKIVKREYFGDVLKFANRRGTPDEVNDDTEVTNTISIVADPFAYENFQFMAYVTWMGTKWKISRIDVDLPRLNISLGGIYNGVE